MALPAARPMSGRGSSSDGKGKAALNSFALLPALLLLAACSGGGGSAQGPAFPPRRIVSMNPCVDTVLHDIADPASIAGVSVYSREARSTSVPLAWAHRYRAISGSAEDVIAARPDLVIAGPHVSLQTIAALERAKVPLLKVPVAESVAQNRAQVTLIAARIGRPAQGAALNRRIDAALARTLWQGTSVPALIWQGTGLVPGRGTLADNLMTHAGFRNISRDIGLQQWDILPLEGLLTHPPTVLLAGRADMGAGNGDANRMLTHPALRALAKRVRVENYPSDLLHCGGPVMIRSLERLAQVRRGLEKSERGGGTS